MSPKVTAIPATKPLGHNASATLGVARPVKRVAAYARVSTDMEEQHTSYAAQVDYYTRYITDHTGWQLAGLYTDEGITGTSTKHRDGFQRMVALIAEANAKYAALLAAFDELATQPV